MISLAPLLICLALGSRLQIKTPSITESIAIQIGDIVDLNYPQDNQQEVFSRRVINSSPNDLNVSQICWQNPPNIDFQLGHLFLIDTQRQHPHIVTDFAELQYRRGIIDSKMFENSLYILFENGSLLVVDVAQSGDLYMRRMNSFRNGTIISEGQILMVDGSILIFADYDLYIEGDTDIQELPGYRGTTKFSSAIALNKGFIAVAQRDEGIAIYRLQDKLLTFVGLYAQDFFKTEESIYIVDLATDGKNTLFVLDQKTGLLMVSFSELYEGLASPALIPSGVLKTKCDNILYSKGEVFFVCDNIFRYGIQTDSSIEQLPRPLFKVKEMLAYNDTIIMMGDNLFKIYWHDRYVDLYQFEGADTIIFTADRYIAIQDTIIYTGTYVINSPTLSCQAPSFTQESTVGVLFKTEGKCVQEYLSSVNDTTQFQANDTCVYTTPASINFWKGDDIDFKPLIVGFISLGAFIMLILIWMCVIVMKQRSLDRILRHYSVVNSGKSQYNVMEDQKEHNDSVQKNRSKKDLGQQLMTIQSAVEYSQRDQNPGEIKPKNDSDMVEDQVHDIGD